MSATEATNRDLVAEAVADILGDTWGQLPISDRDHGWAPEAWSALEASGMTALTVPESLGGPGGSLDEATTVIFEAARMAVPLPLWETMVAAGWLAAAASWTWKPGVQTLAIAPETARCHRNGQGLVLRTTIPHVPWARYAIRLIVLASDGEQDLLIGLDSGQFSVASADNLAGEPRDTVVIDAEVGPSAWTGRAPTRSAVLQRLALGRTVQTAGALCTVLDLAVRHASERVQFGRPIARFQSVQRLLAVLAGEVTASVAAARAATDAVVHDEDHSNWAVTAARVRACLAATRGARVAHQIHGAMGITQEHSLHLYTRRLWAWRDEPCPQSEFAAQLPIAVRQGGGADALWPIIASGASGKAEATWAGEQAGVVSLENDV